MLGVPATACRLPSSARSGALALAFSASVIGFRTGALSAGRGRAMKAARSKQARLPSGSSWWARSVRPVQYGHEVVRHDAHTAFAEVAQAFLVVVDIPLKSPVCVLMCSCTGTLSTTDQRRPAASIISLRFMISSTVHTSPLGMWCRAFTMPLAPACLMSHRLTGSLGPVPAPGLSHKVSYCNGISL